jgi:hypothetical protein
MIWMFAGSAITKLASAAGGAALLAGLLNSPNTWVSGRSPDTPPTATRLFYTSNSDLQVGTIGRGVVVDLEAWPYTPLGQQRQLVSAYRRAAQWAKQHGQWVVAAPATDLVHSVVPGYRGKIYPEFVRLHLAQKIAPYAQVYEIQAQEAERNPLLYRRFVRAIVDQVHKGNPQATILAGLSTNPAGGFPSLSVLYRDIQETGGMVSGYWLNIPQPGGACPRCGPSRPELAVRLLRLVAR